MNFAKISSALSLTTVAVLATLVSTVPACSDDQYWQFITGTCEPCSAICDPPRRHENDCPDKCPNYIPTTTTARTTTTTTTTTTTASPETDASPVSPWIIIISVILGALVVGTACILSYCIFKRLYAGMPHLKAWFFNCTVAGAGAGAAPVVAATCVDAAAAADDDDDTVIAMQEIGDGASEPLQPRKMGIGKTELNIGPDKECG